MDIRGNRDSRENPEDVIKLDYYADADELRWSQL